MMDRPAPDDPIAFPDGPPEDLGNGDVIVEAPPADPPRRERKPRRKPVDDSPPPAQLGRWSFSQMGVKLLEPNPWQPRKTFDETGMVELTASVREKGVLQPILCRPKPGTGVIQGEEGPDIPMTYEIAAGERRWRAAERAGLSTVPAYVRDLTDEQMQAIAVIENAEREGLPPMEEADAVKAMLQIRQPNGEPYTPEIVAQQLGRGLTWTYQRLKLTELIQDFRDALNDGRITIAHALIAARLAPSAQDLLADAALYERQWSGQLGAYKRGPLLPATKISNPQTWDAFVKESVLLDLDRAPFSKTDPSLNPAQGACEKCELRTGNLPSLFGDVKAGICTAPACYAIKLDVFLRRAITEIQEEKGVLLYAGYDQPAKGHIAVEFNAIPKNKWEPVGKKKCEHQVWGLILGGQRDDGARVGERLKVCLESTCKVHHPYGNGTGGGTVGRAGRKATPAERERRSKELFDQEVKRRLRWRLGRMAADGIVKRGTRAILSHMLEYAWQETNHDAQVGIARELGWELPKGSGNQADATAGFRAWLKDPKGISRDQMMVYLTFAESIKWGSDYTSPSSYANQPARFGTVVKSLGLDIAATEKQIRVELTEERAARKRKSPVAPAAKKGGKAGKPTTKARKR